MADTQTIDGDNYELNSQVGYLLRLASQRHAAIFQTHAINGLTPTQFAAMVRINEQGQCSQNHLGRLAAMDVATIKGVVDRLRHKGLIVSEADPNDKRRSLVSLSEAGQQMMDQLHEIGHMITAETLDPLTKAERRNLVKILQKIS